MLRSMILAISLAALVAPPALADPQKFASEENATKFCKQGNVVWFNPDSKIYFEPGSQHFGKTKSGGFTCRAAAEKDGYKANKGS